MALYKGLIPIIKRSLDEGWIRGLPTTMPSTGAVERDFDVDPVMMRESPDKMELLDEANYDAAYDEAEAQQTSLEHMFLRGGAPAFLNLDQNGFPDCWAYSTGQGMMMDAMKQGIEIPRYAPTGVATMLRQTNGGWCGLSKKFASDNGYPVEGNGPGQWPALSRKGKDTPELRAAMALHKVTKDWYDFGRKEYNQVLSQKQLHTMSNQANPCPADWMDYGHSMLLVRVVRIERGVWRPLVLNSWKGWGYHGLGVLPIWPNNAVSILSTTSTNRLAA